MELSDLDLSERQAVIDLLVEYSWSIDTGEAERLAGLFLPDGYFEGSDGTVTRGRAELIAFGERVFSSRPCRLQHVTSNYRLEVEGPGRVRVTSYVHIYAGETEGVRLLGMGSYDDRVVRTDTGWRFQARKFASWRSSAP